MPNVCPCRTSLGRIEGRAIRGSLPTIRAEFVLPGRAPHSPRTGRSKRHRDRSKENIHPIQSGSSDLHTNPRQLSMAAAICGPGILLTPNISTWCSWMSDRMVCSDGHLEIAVDDLVLFAPFQHCSQGQYGQRKPTFRGVVARGLKSMIISPPQRRRYENAMALACREAWQSGAAAPSAHRTTG